MKNRWKLACVALLTAGASLWAQAQSTLTAQPIKIVVPFAPGGATDLYARQIAGELGRRGIAAVVDNRPGASGVIAATAVARARPDGHTLLVSTLGTLVSNTVMVDKLTYDPQKDLRGVTQIGYQPTVMVARMDVPFKDARQMVAYAKAHPAKINRGSPGAAIISNLAPLGLEKQYGFSTTHVPFNGDTPGMTALLGGQIDVLASSITSPMPYLRDGRLRLLGVSGSKRLPFFPDVETFQEQGYEFNGDTWYGLSAPSATPDATIAELNRIVNAVLADPAFRARAMEMGMEPRGGTAQAYDSTVRTDAERWIPELRKIRDSLAKQP